MVDWPRERQVHLWRISLEQPTQPLELLLSGDEVERANRFVFDRDRRRYVVARGALRSILGAYLGRRPEALRFAYGPRGKPSIEREALRFNLAHSHQLALVAMTVHVSVGVDVELLRPIEGAGAGALSARLFCAKERARLAAAPAEDRNELFLTYWTRKEAILKLTGQGLAHPLDALEVAWAGDTSPPCVIEDAVGAEWRVSVRDVRPAPGYVGALAVEGGHARAMAWRTYAAGTSASA